METNLKPCGKCGCTMRYVLPRVVINGEVVVPDPRNPEYILWQCPGCSYSKIFRSTED